MKQKDFYKQFELLQKESQNIMLKKNQDYSNSEDAFANFRLFGALGILVRMSDKLSRLKQILESGNISVKEETIKDTCLDLANYSYILQLYYDNSSKKESIR